MHITQPIVTLVQICFCVNNIISHKNGDNTFITNTGIIEFSRHTLYSNVLLYKKGKYYDITCMYSLVNIGYFFQNRTQNIYSDT